MRAAQLGWVVASVVVPVLTAVACTGPADRPPDAKTSGAQATTDTSGPSAFAYSRPQGVQVVRGTATVADIALDSDSPVSDAEWTADGARFVLATNAQLVSVDAGTGAVVKADCTCSSIAVAAGKVFVLDRYGGAELTVYDATTLTSQGSLKPDLGRATGLMRIEGAGDRLVTFQITADGARPLTDVVVVHPDSGETTTVGRTDEIGAPADAAYTPRGWLGTPMFAYVALGSAGATRGIDSVVWFDPTTSTPQVVTDDQPLRARSPDVAAEDWNSGRDNLWWSPDGTLRATAWTWSCTDSGQAGPPACVDLLAHTQWRFDGTGWDITDERDLTTVRDLGGGVTVELTRPSGGGLGDQQLTLVEGPKRSVLATDVRRLWTGPAPAGSTKPGPAVTVVNLNAAMGYRIEAGNPAGTDATPEDLADLADDILSRGADIANLQEMAKPAALELRAILAARTGHEWQLNWAHSGTATYYPGKEKDEAPSPGYRDVSAGNAQLVRIGDGVRSQQPITLDGEHDDQGILLPSGGRSFAGAQITTEHGVVDVYVTHLAREKDASDEVRARDVQRLQEFTESRTNPAVVTGDFNQTIDYVRGQPYPNYRTVDALRSFMDTYGYTDLARDKGPTSNQKAEPWERPALTPLRIDYILARGVQTRDTARFESHQSDHWGLVTTIDPG